MTRRKVQVQGTPLEVARVVGEGLKNSIIAIPHEGKIVMIFMSDNNVPTAWSMTKEEAGNFSVDVKAAHQALEDDAKIARLEKEFGDEH